MEHGSCDVEGSPCSGVRASSEETTCCLPFFPLGNLKRNGNPLRIFKVPVPGMAIDGLSYAEAVRKWSSASDQDAKALCCGVGSFREFKFWKSIFQDHETVNHILVVGAPLRLLTGTYLNWPEAPQGKQLIEACSCRMDRSAHVTEKSSNLQKTFRLS